jgi:hypothetical protein
VKIPRHNWETQQLDYIEYPDAIFEPFLVWLLTTSAWQEDHSRVEAKVRMLERAMADYRNPPDTHREAEVFVAPPVAEVVPVKRKRGRPKKAKPEVASVS